MTIENTPRRWLLDVELDPATQEYVITIPQKVIDELGWRSGDTINWEVREDGAVLLSRKDGGATG